MIYAAALGPKQLWIVPGAYHTAAYGFAPEEFRRRVLAFFGAYANAPATASTPSASAQVSAPFVSAAAQEPCIA
ncbi:MAG TPA: hypothetical protein VFN26_03555 [Candidatus Acidoferrum sp.]|nr:hypothetical protein [Candidatus Acidoferrum sp.]